MHFYPGACIILLGHLTITAALLADDEKSKTKQPTGTITVLATLRGEIAKVSDGGWKIKVKYEDVVGETSRATVSSTQGAANYPRYHLPPLHLTNLKEKKEEVELRLLESTKVRFVPITGEKPKGKGSQDTASKDDKKDDKTDPKAGASTTKKTEKKTKEPALPGKAGEPSQLAKGQIVNVTVAREDFPNFSRYVATVVLVVGEK
jgi:hypothetical protein